MKILVTGGAGYIGSHTTLELLLAGYDVIVVDNLINSSEESLRRIKKLTGKEISFHNIDLCNTKALDEVFSQHEIDAVIHFAGLKAVGESVAKPLYYYQNNLEGTISLCRVMEKHKVYKLIFSSSATVYNQDEPSPWTEETPAGSNIGSPYGKTKYMSEQILKDLSSTNTSWRIAILRYFNPVGAHESGLIGEDPLGIPNNLLPFISQVAVGKRPKLFVFGNDYPTPDGTCIRDYIHVTDLAKGHIAALEHLAVSDLSYDIFNLGTGKGTSVLEVIAAFEKAANKTIPYEIVGRRPGDAPNYYADPSKANKVLKWHTTKTIYDACIDAWRWQSKNPNGFKLA